MNRKPNLKFDRTQLAPGENLCEHCTAKCCRYFALPIDTPKTKRDFDFMRWYLLHGRASIFVEEPTWYLLVHTTCKHLQADHRCGIYHTRPQICRLKLPSRFTSSPMRFFILPRPFGRPALTRRSCPLFNVVFRSAKSRDFAKQNLPRERDFTERDTTI